VAPGRSGHVSAELPDFEPVLAVYGGVAMFNAVDQRLGECAVVSHAALERRLVALQGGKGDDAAALGRRDGIHQPVDVDIAL
jgi:hypothetical protein